MPKKQPRGIRNHNPGNIENKGPNGVGGPDPWQGLAPQQSDPRFLQFDSPEMGIRAMAKILLSYQKKHGIQNIRGAISRYAPPVENDTAGYVNTVAKMSKIDPDSPVNFEDSAVLTPLLEAMIKVENGVQPYDKKTIEKGVNLALGK